MKPRHLLGTVAAAAVALPSALPAIDTDADGLDDSVETNTGVYGSPSNTASRPDNPDGDGTDWECHTFKPDVSGGLGSTGFLRAKVEYTKPPTGSFQAESQAPGPPSRGPGVLSCSGGL